MRPRTPAPLPKLGGTHEDDASLEACLLAEAGETRGSVADKKSHANATRSYLERISSEHAAVVAPVQHGIGQCDAHLADLQMEQRELLRHLNRVEKDMAAALARRSTLESELHALNRRYEVQVSQMDSSQQLAYRALRLDEGVLSTIKQVRDLEAKLTLAIGSVQGPLAPPAEEYPVRVAAASEALGAYIEAETKCMAALARRVKLVADKIQTLKREVEEYRSLGMQVSQAIYPHVCYAYMGFCECWHVKLLYGNQNNNFFC